MDINQFFEYHMNDEIDMVTRNDNVLAVLGYLLKEDNGEILQIIQDPRFHELDPSIRWSTAIIISNQYSAVSESIKEQVSKELN